MSIDMSYNFFLRPDKNKGTRDKTSKLEGLSTTSFKRVAEL